MRILKPVHSWKSRGDDGQYEQRCQAAGQGGHLRAEPSGDDAGFKLTELGAAAGENAVDRRHAAAQLVGRAQLVDRRSKNRADRVAGAGKRQHEKRKPEDLGAGEQHRGDSVNGDTEKNPAAAVSYGAEQRHGAGSQQ